MRAGLLSVVDDPTDLDLVERIGVLAAAGEASPHAKALILGELHAWLDWYEGWLRRRLGPEPSELHVATVASATVGAAEAALRVWARHAVEGSASPTSSFHAAFAEALGYLGTDLLPDTVVRRH